MEENRGLGSAIRQMRLEAGYPTMRSLAEHLPIGPEQLRKIEEGLSLPSDEVLDRITQVLRCDRGYLYALRETDRLSKASRMLLTIAPRDPDRVKEEGERYTSSPNQIGVNENDEPDLFKILSKLARVDRKTKDKFIRIAFAMLDLEEGKGK